MLAGSLWLLELCEFAVLAALVVAATAQDIGLPVALGLALGAALAWRAALVLGIAWAGGAGWQGWRRSAAETWAFTLAYLTMTVEPVRAALEPLARHAAGPRGTHPEAAAEPPAALVLLHGWCCNAGVWRPLRAAWRRRGGEPPIAVTVTPALGDIDAMADGLARRLAPLLATRRPLLLVAHSMGGLVARRWLQVDAEAARLVVGLVTVGTPHAGTRLARFGPGRAAAQMRPGGAWLGALAAREPPCPVLCVWSDADTFVVPAASARLPRARSRHFAGRGHFGMLRDPRLAPLLAACLAACLGPGAQRSATRGAAPEAAGAR